VVRTAIEWNWNRAKVQWKFLLPRQRTWVKALIFLSLIWTCLLFDDIFDSSDHFFFSRGVWIVADLLMAYFSASAAWHEFSDTLSPELLTAEDLTEGTE
jgi:hypothetical protein